MTMPTFPISQAVQRALEATVADALQAAISGDAASLRSQGFAVSAVRAGQHLICRIANQANAADYVDVCVPIRSPLIEAPSPLQTVKHHRWNGDTITVSTR